MTEPVFSATLTLDQVDEVTSTSATGGHASVTLALSDAGTGRRLHVQGLPYSFDSAVELGVRYVLTLTPVS